MRYHSTKKWCLVGAVVGLLGCRTSLQEAEPSIQFCVLNPAASKGSGLSAGDEVAVCARLDGAEHYFLQHATFIIGADGRSLTVSPAVYYPQVKQAVTFYAYFPYHTGLFSVPSDQSTAAALKQADLCWATAKSTPVPTLVPLEFEHTMARLVVVANKTPTKITVPNALVGGSLDIKTGVFTPTSRSEVSTTGGELIVPVQPLSRLVLTVSGIEYVFEGPINLQSGQTTTLKLTLNPSTQTATLSGSSTTAWTTSNKQGIPEQAVSNLLTLHWANYIPQGTTPNKITLTIGGVDYTINSGITYANKTFTVPFASDQLRYPYTITKIVFYNGSIQALPSCTQLQGAAIYKSTTQTLGIKDPANAIFINGLWWAVGNLVAAVPRGGAGLGGCTIGDPSDGGLYFQFGSLIGWKGGNKSGSGNGVGILVASEGSFWESSFSWTTESYLWPDVMVGNPTGWPILQSTNKWYFGLRTGWSTNGQDIRTFPGFANGSLANAGVGDPCTFYLSPAWRTPTADELSSLTGKTGYLAIPYSTTGLLARWVDLGSTVAGIVGPGAWVGPGMSSTATPDPTKHLFIRAQSYRSPISGAFSCPNQWSLLRSSVVGHGMNSTDPTPGVWQRYLALDSREVLPTYVNTRDHGFAVRCVAN